MSGMSRTCYRQKTAVLPVTVGTPEGSCSTSDATVHLFSRVPVTHVCNLPCVAFLWCAVDGVWASDQPLPEPASI